MKQASELEYLTWFRHNIDLGPGEQDVIDDMNERFIEETGKELPEGWGKEWILSLVPYRLRWI